MAEEEVRSAQGPQQPKRAVNQNGADLERPYRMASAAAFVLVMIVLGVPLWWNTTKVYRASIPRSRIASLASHRIRIPVLIRIGYTSETSSKYISNLTEILYGNLQDLSVHEKLKLDFVIYKLEVESAETDSFGWTEAFVQDFLIVPENHWKRPGELYFGSGNIVFVRFGSDAQRTAKLIESAIVDVSLDVGQLRTVIRRDLKQRETGWELATMTQRDQKRRVWESAALPAKEQIDVVFVVPEPAKCDPSDATTTVSSYLRPFVIDLFPVTELIVHSENLYYVELPPWHRRDQILNADVLDADKLPVIVNPLERYLTTVESTAPVFRLEGDPVKENSFVVASWGGLTIVNNCSFDQSELAAVLIGQLRILLGLETELPPRSTKSENPLAEWELSRLAIRSVVDNLLRATTTLSALDKLLDEITNIVIADEIAERIEEAVSALEESFKQLKKDELGLPLGLARAASEQADEAFFDPSLLALLYFPDDQKYAIYIPLFLPIGVPVVFSLKALYSYYIKRHSDKTGKTD